MLHPPRMNRHRSIPVSYTHLDVYKRQALKKGRSENEWRGIGIAIPGPFDYTRGIAAIHGVRKFESLVRLTQIAMSIDMENSQRTFLFGNGTDQAVRRRMVASDQASW